MYIIYSLTLSPRQVSELTLYFESVKTASQFRLQKATRGMMKDAPCICLYTVIISWANNGRVVFGDGRRISKDSRLVHAAVTISFSWAACQTALHLYILSWNMKRTNSVNRHCFSVIFLRIFVSTCKKKKVHYNKKDCGKCALLCHGEQNY